MEAAVLLNLTDYSVLEHVVFAAGCLLWVFTYVIVIRNVRRYDFIEIPLVAVCANFAWEFLWSFVFQTDMGSLYIWGYRIWFFLDCFIVFGLLRYGYKQIPYDLLRRTAGLVTLAVMASWFVGLYFYIDLYDAPVTHMGANSGYILNVVMSALYIPLFMRLGKDEVFSYAAAWYKGVGTLLISVFCFLHFTDGFLLTMCVVTGLLDVGYVAYLTVRRIARVAA
ncbi:MAG: hypothetical protein WED81_03135 [Rhodothermales bacterium]